MVGYSAHKFAVRVVMFEKDQKSEKRGRDGPFKNKFIMSDSTEVGNGDLGRYTSSPSFPC